MRIKNLIFLFFYTFSPLAVLAQGLPAAVPEGPDINPAPSVDTPNAFLEVLQNALGWAFAFALVIGVAVLIAAGIMYLTAGGGERTKTATTIMIYAIVGIAVAGFAWAIINVVQGILFEAPVNVSVGGS